MLSLAYVFEFGLLVLIRQNLGLPILRFRSRSNLRSFPNHGTLNNLDMTQAADASYVPSRKRTQQACDAVSSDEMRSIFIGADL